MKRYFSIRKMKLASKTASVIGIVVTLVLVLQSLISIRSTSGAVSTAISGEFNNIAVLTVWSSGNFGYCVHSGIG